MSLRQLTLVWEHARAEGGDLLVLLALADEARDDGGCYPGIDRIAAKARMSERNVRYVLRRLEDSGELAVIPGGGRKNTNKYEIRVNPNLELGLQERGQDFPKPGKIAPKRGQFATETLKPIAPEPYYLKATVVAGEAKASPVPALFEAYRHGIKTTYGAEYPPSAAANGILAKMAKRLGAGPALQVLQAYLASTKPFYVARKHALEILAKDATEIWIELQQRQSGRAGGPARPITAAKVQIINADDTEGRRLQDYPPGDPQQIAKKAFTDYRNMIAKLPSARYIAVRQGQQAARFSLEELRA